MKLTFYTYSKRTKLYRALELVVAVGLIEIIIFIFFPEWLSGLSSVFQAIIIIPFFIAVGVKLFEVVIGMALIKTCIVDGQISLSEDNITINDTVLPVRDLKSIEIWSPDYRGMRTRDGLSDGSGNRIEITVSSEEVIKYKFIIASNNEMNDLRLMLLRWKQQGFKIISNNIDLI